MKYKKIVHKVGNLFFLICWARNAHRFQLPEGPPETTQVHIDTLACMTCGKDFLEVIAYQEEISREAARAYFTTPYLNPVALPKTQETSKTTVIRNSWWR